MQVAVIIPEHPNCKPFNNFNSEPGKIEKFNLISGLHTFCSQKNEIYKNILPPLRLLNAIEEKDLLDNLKNLNFTLKSRMAA